METINVPNYLLDQIATTQVETKDANGVVNVINESEHLNNEYEVSDWIWQGGLEASATDNDDGYWIELI